jgi:hypothetical protein
MFVRTNRERTTVDQRYAATEGEQAPSNVTERDANHQILSAFPERAYRHNDAVAGRLYFW